MSVVAINPVYDSTEKRTLTFGGNHTGGLGKGLTTAGEYGLTYIEPIHLKPGVYNLADCQSAVISNWLAGQGVALYALVWIDSGSDTIPHVIVPMTPLATDNYQAVPIVVANAIGGSSIFTVADGDKVYFGHSMFRADDSVSPIIRSVSYSGTTASTRFANRFTHTFSDPGIDLATIISALTISGTPPDNGVVGTFINELVVETQNLTAISFGAAGIPWFDGSADIALHVPELSVPAQIILRDVEVSDGDILTLLLQRWNTDGTVSTEETLTLDASASPNHQIGFGGATIDLNGKEFDPAGTPSEFEIVLNMRPGDTNKIEAAFCNRTKGQGGQGENDIAWRCHSTVNAGNGTRDAGYTADLPRFVTAGKTGVGGGTKIDSISVGTGAIVVPGDSMALESRLGGEIGNAMPNAPEVILVSIGGNKLTETVAGGHTAIRDRFLGQTGDLGELTGVYVWVPGCGTNDISQINTGITNPGDVVVAAMTNAVAFIVSEAKKRRNAVGILGVFDNQVSDEEKAAIDSFNDSMLAIARAAKSAFFNPAPTMRENANYLDGDGVHYNSDGVDHITQAFASAYMAGYVPPLVKHIGGV